MSELQVACVSVRQKEIEKRERLLAKERQNRSKTLASDGCKRKKKKRSPGSRATGGFPQFGGHPSATSR